MNEDKMIEVLANVEDERAAYHRGNKDAVGFNMEHWFRQFHTTPLICRSTACLAGHAMLNAGYETTTSAFEALTTMVNPRTGEEVSIEDTAAELLDLNDDEALVVFYLDDLDAVYRWVADKMGVDDRVLHDKVQAVRPSRNR